MTITLDPVPQLDSRGLPQGMDPESLFRYRYDTLAKGAVGFESFLYKYIPYNLVKSFAFAIDPTHRFKVAPGIITATNRTKYRSTATVFDRSRRRTVNHYYMTWSQEPNYKGHFFCGSPYMVYNLVDSSQIENTALTDAVPVVDELNDTTKRTRLIGSSQGELTLFKSTLFSPPRTNSWREYTRWYKVGITPPPECVADGGIRDYEIGGDRIWTTTIGPTAARLSREFQDTFAEQEIAFCKELSSKHAIPLLKDANPFSRDYSLSRNIAELKDIPRAIGSHQQTMNDLRNVWTSLRTSPKTRAAVFDLSTKSTRNIPSEYLGFHFGWKQTFKDLQDLLRTPERVSRKIDLLIRRSGLPTTYRRKRATLSGRTMDSGFVYETHAREFPEPNGLKICHRVSRESETRLVINATFDFPPINAPQFRRDLFLDKIGLIPRFTDVYNIIPWTWLLDWFTGLGNYIEIIEEINHDPSLINWGMITTKTSGKLTTEFICDAPTIRYIRQDDTDYPRQVDNVLYPHTSILEYECQTRQNVANVLDVKQTTIRDSLSPYQLSILGAILAQRIDYTRHSAFR